MLNTTIGHADGTARWVRGLRGGTALAAFLGLSLSLGALAAPLDPMSEKAGERPAINDGWDIEFTMPGPILPAFAGALGDSCEEHLYTELPDVITVINPTGLVNGGMALQVQIYPGDVPYGHYVYPVFDETRRMARGDYTPIRLDKDVLVENALYDIRVRALYDGGATDWNHCSFWVDELNEPPTAATVAWPPNGYTFGVNEKVEFEIINAGDPDPMIGNRWVDLAYCAHQAVSEGDCMTEPDIRIEVPQQDIAKGRTIISMEGLDPGVEYTFNVCAVDAANADGPIDQLAFSIDEEAAASGCATPIGAGSGAAAGLLFVLLGLRRRGAA